MLAGARSDKIYLGEKVRHVFLILALNWNKNKNTLA